MDKQLFPRVGVGVIIKNKDKILLGKRKGSHGEGTWAPPGGNLDYGEKPDSCAIREVYEETGLHVVNPRFVSYTNDIFKREDKHYITLWIRCDYINGEPQLLEVDKCEEWKWFSTKKLPKSLFVPFENLLKQQAKI